MTTKWWFYLGQVNIDSLIHVLWKTIEVNLSRPRRHFPCTRLTKRLFQVLSEHAQIGVGWGWFQTSRSWKIQTYQINKRSEILDHGPNVANKIFPSDPPPQPNHTTPQTRGEFLDPCMQSHASEVLTLSIVAMTFPILLKLWQKSLGCNHRVRARGIPDTLSNISCQRLRDRFESTFAANDKNDSPGNKIVCGVEGKRVNMLNLSVSNLPNRMNHVYKHAFK